MALHSAVAAAAASANDYHMLLGGAAIMAVIGLAWAYILVLSDADDGVRSGQIMQALALVVEGLGLGIGAIGVYYLSGVDPFSWVAGAVGLIMIVGGWWLFHRGDRAERRVRLAYYPII